MSCLFLFFLTALITSQIPEERFSGSYLIFLSVGIKIWLVALTIVFALGTGERLITKKSNLLGFGVRLLLGFLGFITFMILWAVFKII